MDAPLPSFDELWDDIRRLREQVRPRLHRLDASARARWDELERRVVTTEWKGRPRDVSVGHPAHGAAFELDLAVREFASIHFPDLQKQGVW